MRWAARQHYGFMIATSGYDYLRRQQRNCTTAEYRPGAVGRFANAIISRCRREFSILYTAAPRRHATVISSPSGRVIGMRAIFADAARPIYCLYGRLGARQMPAPCLLSARGRRATPLTILSRRRLAVAVLAAPRYVI